ncbi:MAG: 5-carboxymethylaminomethyluridine-tRNA synthase GTPase subunit [Candidatus Westeberhardia cardiocondylae]|nr:5-carboxymethylaminomethyluridine-tRNA synthase GTPase subunit [Candidatus Westeberhardia cardiocondylae]
MKCTKNFDTIAAISTPLGCGGIGVIRISGSLVVPVIIPKILKESLFPNKAKYLSFFDEKKKVLDKGIALFFSSPFSFTGEDVLELQGHGNPVILNILLKRVISFPGVRMARPGEFSERAFYNKKLDLIQAEAIFDFINADSAYSASLAMSSMQGTFSTIINKLVEDLIKIRVYIEGILNFPNENFTGFSEDIMKSHLDDILVKLEKVCIEAHKSNRSYSGMNFVIVGESNVGKSSLLNKLIKKEVAIVSKIVGTTRDILRYKIYLNGISFNIIDTAGFNDNVTNEIERIGIQRTFFEMKNADHILFMIDAKFVISNISDISNIGFFSQIPKEIPTTIIRNKSDLVGEFPKKNKISRYTIITLSIKFDQGISLLQEYLMQCCINNSVTEGKLLARERHLNALYSAKDHLIKSKKYFRDNSYNELVAEELRLAQIALDEITGKFSSDDLIKKIFSTFCIGK